MIEKRLSIPVVTASFVLAVACGGSTPAPQSQPTGQVAAAQEGGEVPAPQPGAPDPVPSPAAPVPEKPKTLYDRLGGEGAVTAVVGEFVARLAADPRIKFRFVNSDIPTLSRQLFEFVCVATGGGCTYTGRDMRVGHASMNTTEAEWDAVVEALVGALDKFAVPAAEKSELLGALGGIKDQIVDPPAETPSGKTLARIDAAAKDLARFGDSAELMGAAFTALRAGQRSYAEQLFSMAEVELGPKAVAKIAPLFRKGAPPRITATPTQQPLDTAAQPGGAVGSSDEDNPPKPARGSLSGRMRLEGKGGVAFGVVTLTPVKGGGKRRTPKRRVIEQRGREFAPRLMAVPAGSTVEFPNFDPIYHNVFSRSEVRPFDLGIFKNGQAREVKFDKEGIVRIGCNLHANMSSAIIVVKAPHYAVTDAQGGFRFRSLAPGKYKLRAWTERSAEPTATTIEVKEGANNIVVDASREAAPQPSLDKFGAERGKSPAP